MSDYETCDHEDDEGWTEVEFAAPLSGLSLFGHVAQAAGNVLTTIGASLQGVAQEFFAAAVHAENMREIREQTKFANDTRADFERMFPNE